MTLDDILRKAEDKFRDASSIVAKFNHINNIIQIKKRIYEEDNLDELYKDIKVYIDCELRSVDERQYDYDGIDFDKIESYVEMLSVEKREKLYCYLERKMKLYGFEDDLARVQMKRKKSELSYYLKSGWSDNGVVGNIFKVVFSVSSYNLKCIFASMIFLVIIGGAFLLPAPIDDFALFEVKYGSYGEDLIYNHYVNIFMTILGFETAFEVKPIGLWGVGLLFAYKAFFFFVIVNYLLKELEKRVGG